MQKFDLCSPLHGDVAALLVPELLPDSEPSLPVGTIGQLGKLLWPDFSLPGGDTGGKE